MIQLYGHVRSPSRSMAGRCGSRPSHARVDGRSLGSAHVDPGRHHTLGPENGTLSVRTEPHRRRGQGRAQPPDPRHRLAGDARGRRRPSQTSIVLAADATSLRVREGTGGMQALGDDDKASIQQTIDDEVLKRTGDRVPLDRGADADDGGRISVQGELTLVGTDPPDRVRPHGRRRRQAQRQRRRQADRLGDHALLDAVRGPEGRRRGRGRDRVAPPQGSAAEECPTRSSQRSPARRSSIPASRARSGRLSSSSSSGSAWPPSVSRPRPRWFSRSWRRFRSSSSSARTASVDSRRRTQLSRCRRSARRARPRPPAAGRRCRARRGRSPRPS